MKNKNMIDEMTLEEKVAFLSGTGMWHTKAIDRLNIPPIMMTDGPHGLRKIADETQTNIYGSVKSTCFPTASLSACSWDEQLLEEMGNAIAEEALQEQISIVLGPGANIKRSPLCGRNFEYFSEDPLLAGKLAAGWIRGVEKRGVGSSLKHFALNNQEFMRLTISAEVDARAVREIYLKPFEIAVKEGKPSTVMCAYNRINGEFCASNKWLLTDVLRNDWGFDGLVMSDWGAVDDKVKGIAAGMDLEMPDSKGYYDKQVIEAINDGILSNEALDTSVDRVLELVKNRGESVNDYHYDIQEHSDLAEKIALESAVLLKNDGILPLNIKEKILVIGSLAKNARFQGGGSSHISPHKVTNLLDGLKEIGVDFQYSDGYINEDKQSDDLLAQALKIAPNYNKIILCVGLTDSYETEGMDRAHMNLPENQLQLIKAIMSLDKKIVMVYFGGSPSDIPCEKAGALLSMYLSGESGGKAAAKLLYGVNNPCGKLAETFPINIADTPCYSDFGKGLVNAVYSESIYVGYRYYDSAKIDVKYPFGHGLSYTRYEYFNLQPLKASYHTGEKILLKFNLANAGSFDGKEIIQVYVRKIGGKVFAPYQELRAFRKVQIDAQKCKPIEMELAVYDLAIYDVNSQAFRVESADYEIAIGTSSRDIRLKATVNVVAEELQPVITDSWYNAPSKAPSADFNALRGYAVTNEFVTPKKGSFTMENSLIEIAPNSFLARRIMAIAGFIVRHSMHLPKTDTSYIMINEMFKTSPLKKLSLSSQGAFSQGMCEGLVLMLNGKFFKGLWRIIKSK